MQPQRGGDDFAPRNMFGQGRDMDARRMQMQQARNRSQMASGPAPQMFTPAPNMGQRVTTVQGYEMGRPDLQGPQVLRDYGEGQYGYGTDPQMIRNIAGQYGKFFT
jgi:hypothetical protein